MIYFTADTHFGHTNVIDYENRPFVDATEMDFSIIRRWNSVVKPEDTVYHLGDVGFVRKSRLREIVNQLNGTKILIRGNHDTKPRSMENLGFAACLEAAFINVGSHCCYISHHPILCTAPGSWVIHGHVHSQWKVQKEHKRICVSVENWHYTPVSESQLTSIMDKAGS